MILGSLFSGIGGIDLGFERAGFKVAWQVEINAYCRRVLAKHWPDVRRHDDVKTFPPAGDWSVDCIAGGFPCQDISNAGKRAGIEGEQSGLWAEFARIIGVVRPRYVVVENVDALLVRGMGRVLGDLAALGFDAEWGRIPAAAFGAPHRRWRLFVVAHARTEGLPTPERETIFGAGRRHKGRAIAQCSWWAAEPGMGRVAHGVPRRVDRLGGLGNAVVPQVAEWIAREIKWLDAQSV